MQRAAHRVADARDEELHKVRAAVARAHRGSKHNVRRELGSVREQDRVLKRRERRVPEALYLNRRRGSARGHVSQRHRHQRVELVGHLEGLYGAGFELGLSGCCGCARACAARLVSRCALPSCNCVARVSTSFDTERGSLLGWVASVKSMSPHLDCGFTL